MGNSQGNQSDNRTTDEKSRKSSTTVRGRVLARLKSRSSLQTKDASIEPFSLSPTAQIDEIDCDNEFTNIRYVRRRHDEYGTADIRSADKVYKRFSQISQGADSAKDALDFGKFQLSIILNQKFRAIKLILYCYNCRFDWRLAMCFFC